MKQLFLVLLLCVLTQIQAEVFVYPIPPQIEASTEYKVEITQQGKTFESFVYISHAQVPKYNKSLTTSYTNFDFTGEVRVTVTALRTKINECKILPSSYGISANTKENTVSFILPKPMKVALEFNNNILHPLLIFGNAPETHKPDKNDPNVLYFAPGVHEIDGKIEAKENQTIYLEAGAFVKGWIVGNGVSNVRICGRGILSGRHLGHTGGRFILFNGSETKNITVEDITIVDAPGFYVTTQSENTHVKNIKGIGWHFNTDGLSIGPNSTTEDCFLKCNDDAIKLYHSGQKVYRTTIWQMENGSPFQISWNMPSNNSGFEVKDCDVIRVDHAWDNPNEAIFDAIHGGNGNMSDYLFENIRIENADWRLVNIIIRPNKFSKAEYRGKISNLTFKNITVNVPKGFKRVSVIQGENTESMVTNVVFNNLIINGKYVHSALEGGFEICSRTTKNISFRASEDLKDDTQQKDDFATQVTIKNPITDGLNSYGMKDFHLIFENGWYLTGTEQPNPEWGKRGILLYASNNLNNWKEQCYLIDRNCLPDSCWYKDEFNAPEIHKANNKFYLTFNARNNMLRAYKKTGLAIAVADKITGPYTVLNADKPLVECNNATLMTNTKNETFCYWDMDGRIYGAQIQLDSAKFIHAPKEILGPSTLKKEYHFLDAPAVVENEGKYHMLFTSFYGGYKVLLRYCTATSPLGPWTYEKSNPLMTFIEDEADTELKMPYSKGFTFAPPTQVVFQHDLCKTPNNEWIMTYHSSEKYAEPFLVIEPVNFKNGTLQIPNPKQENYLLNFSNNANTEK